MAEPDIRTPDTAGNAPSREAPHSPVRPTRAGGRGRASGGLLQRACGCGKGGASSLLEKVADVAGKFAQAKPAEHV